MAPSPPPLSLPSVCVSSQLHTSGYKIRMDGGGQHHHLYVLTRIKLNLEIFYSVWLNWGRNQSSQGPTGSCLHSQPIKPSEWEGPQENGSEQESIQVLNWPLFMGSPFRAPYLCLPPSLPALHLAPPPCRHATLV
jgi:hypothetical protein